ncbi:MAG TPA: hypothetical protein VF530_14020 [Planctomycetota bacterium]
MQVLLFVPDDARAVAEAVLAPHPGARRIDWNALAGDRHAAFASALAGVERKGGFVLLAPPTGKEDLQAIDAACRTVLKSLPRGVFVLPRDEAHAAWRADVQAAHAHFHATRRAHVVVKPGEKPLRKAVSLAGKSSSILRWGALVPMSLVSIALVGVVFVFRDAILRRAVADGLEVAFGARATVGKTVSTLAPSLALTGVSVANKDRPMRNLFEFDELEAGVDALQLLSGRVHVDALVLEGLRFNGERTESGALERDVAPEPEPEESATGTGVLFEAALDDLLARLTPPDVEELETVRRAREIERETRARGARIEEQLRSSPIPRQLEEALARVQGLARLEPPASLASVQQALEGLGVPTPDGAALEAAKAGLLAANAVDLEEERRSIAAASADIEATRASFETARGLLARAKEIQKVARLDVLKVLALVEELRTAKKGLDGGAARLQQAGRTLDSARTSIARKSAEAGQRLQATREQIAACRQALGQSGGDLAGRPAAIEEQVSRARDDVQRQHQQIVATIGEVEGDLAATRAAAERFRDQVRDDIAFVRAQPELLRKALEDDRVALLERYSLDALDADVLIESVLGERIAWWLKWTLSTYRRVQPWLGSRTRTEKVKMPTGTVYAFPPEEPREPKLWIKRASFKGGMTMDGEPFALTGTAQDLSSAPALTGQGTLELRIESGEKRIVSTVLTSPEGETSVDLSLDGFAVGGRRLGGERVPLELAGGTLSIGVQAVFVGELLTLSARVDLAGLRIAPAEPLEARLAFLEPVLASLSGLSAQLELACEAGRITATSFRSVEGKELTAMLRNALRDEVEEAKRLALERLEEQVSAPRAAALQAVESFLGTAPAAETALLDRVGAAQAALADPRALALGRAAELTRGLELGADPTAAIEGMRQELERIESESAAGAVRIDAACAEQLQAQAGAASLLAEQSEALKGLQKSLEEEIQRITKLAR